MLIFVVTLAVLKFLFGWPISIVGSLVLTGLLTLIMSLVNSRQRS